jgi:hypothetical protein
VTSARQAGRPAGQHTVRRHNRALVLRTVAGEEPVSRARVAARTGLTRGTVSSLVEELLAAGLLAELAAARGATGRPASPLQLNRSGPAGLGVEIGVDAVGACVVDLTDLAALAEHRDGPAGDDFLYVSGGIGVGAGIVLGGRLFHGSGGRAGELGHVVVDPAGPRCTCGGRGCLEREAGLETLCRAAGVGDLDALAAAADRREPAADAALRTGGHALGVALAGAVNLLDVPTVVLGGGYPRLGPVLRDAVADELARRVVWRSRVAVRVSALGAAAALRGAAMMVVRGVLDG